MNYKEAFKILIIVAIIIMPSIMYLSFRSGDHGRNINTIITEQAHQRTMLDELKNNPCVYCHYDKEGKFTVPDSWDCTRRGR